jgi:hypothetical protein
MQGFVMDLKSIVYGRSNGNDADYVNLSNGRKVVTGKEKKYLPGPVVVRTAPAAKYKRGQKPEQIIPMDDGGFKDF